MAIGLHILPTTTSRKRAGKKQVGKARPWHDDDDDDGVESEDHNAKSDPVSPPNPGPDVGMHRGIPLRSLSTNLPLLPPSKPLRLAHLSKSPPPKPAAIMAPPPPPPPKGLKTKKAIGKLKRSIRMVTWYQTLKRKLEGHIQQVVRNVVGKRTLVGGAPSSDKHGLDKAIEEMMKRSAYFQRIEEDVNKHHQEIIELMKAINSFQAKDMPELLQFCKEVEKHLDKLTDESKVLARFEDFPFKKLESLREAAALYTKLEETIDTLKNWKVEPPLGEVLDKVERYFNKIKREIETVERNKEEDRKKFLGNNISFDFSIVDRVKEAMVDISSSCMELALKERREGIEERRRGSVKVLWRAFQLAFRIYSFAGGQDDRADKRIVNPEFGCMAAIFLKLFGWRKASKCKKMIGRVQCRLKLVKNKRSCIARQLREDLVELLRNGHHPLVLDRVEHLFMDENLVATYDILDHYCEFIIINLPYIRRHKDCPNEINEAVSTLIYSSARLGDLPELRAIRKLFAGRYGQRFVNVALHLLPGNLVDTQIKDCLSTKCVTEEVKHRLVEEISRSCFHHGPPLLLDYTPEWQKQENKRSSPRKEKEEMVGEITEFENKSTDPYVQDQRFFVFNSPPSRFLALILFNKSIDGEDEKEEEKIESFWSLNEEEDDQRGIKCTHKMVMNDKKNERDGPPYVRAANERKPIEESVLDRISRSISFPDHVHPKLPDYEEISAKFMALKRERIQNIGHQNTP
ncbi:unnamed protein product [Cuscuta campestris]|uniref:Uncharacterized protein n=1 Tax=Cuscuta campestris TaxID=132261 RepID=A0A484MXU4_9ASTE|nr:unnamed protein product [Cuscuta campestris]